MFGKNQIEHVLARFGKYKGYSRLNARMNPYEKPKASIKKDHLTAHFLSVWRFNNRNWEWQNSDGFKNRPELMVLLIDHEQNSINQFIINMEFEIIHNTGGYMSEIEAEETWELIKNDLRERFSTLTESVSN